MRISYIDLKGERHPMCYSLMAVESICDEFGGLDEMAKSLDSSALNVRVRAVGKVISILMDAGRAYCEEMGMPLPTKINNPSALIDITSPDAIKAIFDTIKNGERQDIEVAEPKNAKPTQEN